MTTGSPARGGKAPGSPRPLGWWHALQFEAKIRELHSYEVPEILAFEATKGEPGFLAWLAAALDKSQGTCADAEDELEEPLVSLDDHAPGQGKYRDLDAYRDYVRRNLGQQTSEAELDALVARGLDAIEESEAVLASTGSGGIS